MNTHARTANTSETLKNGYEALLLSYAAGTLDEAQSLIVASHLTFSAQARAFVQNCEALGGTLMETQCEPVSMDVNALNDVLSRLDQENEPAACQTPTPTPVLLEFDAPIPIQSALGSKPFKWNALLPGMKTHDLKLTCKKNAARFVKVQPGIKTPHHEHKGIEITLVLDGAFSDETGHYNRGDLIVTDETCDHAPLACAKQGCICLVVSSSPVRLKGLARLLNPFLKA